MLRVRADDALQVTPVKGEGVVETLPSGATDQRSANAYALGSRARVLSTVSPSVRHNGADRV